MWISLAALGLRSGCWWSVYRCVIFYERHCETSFKRIQWDANHGINAISYNRVQRYLVSIDFRSVGQDYVALKLSFGTTYGWAHSANLCLYSGDNKRRTEGNLSSLLNIETSLTQNY